MDKKNIKKINKTLARVLEISAIFLFLYLIFLPIYPKVKYKQIEKQYNESFEEIVDKENKKLIINNFLPKIKDDVSPERIIIPKIGVNAPIVESKSSEYGLSKGAWIDPDGSTPSKGGNTIISAHRFKYLPPSNLTFYNLDKLEIGDEIIAKWRDIEYRYKVREVKIVPSTEISILNQTQDDILTLYTCHPVFSQKERLVVLAEKI